MSNIENGKLKIASNGKIAVPRLVPRVVRYQLARFCEWGETKPGEYHYHITPHSLTKAKEQGLKVEHLLALLAKHSDAGIPPVLVKALKRWELNGTEARAETQTVLKVSRPEVLEELRRSKAARFLGEPLGPTTVIVKGGAIQKVMDALTELGLLAEDLTEEK
ncbi:MAG: helicase-associated domain-containing protein [Chloroflexi bacterium]|nr:helicase-associated domain-containing protein [Chloroflexota bacterium]